MSVDVFGERFWRRAESRVAIVRTRGTCSGRWRIKGTRMPTRTIMDTFMHGTSVRELALKYRGLSVDQIEEAIRFEMRGAR